MNLSLPVSDISGIGPVAAKRLKKLEIESIEDLLMHLPFRYDDFREIYKIANFPVNSIGTIKAEVLDFKNQYTKQGKIMQMVELYDGTGKIYAVWFNQPFLSKTLAPGTVAYFSGNLSWWKKNKAMYAPEYEIETDSAPLHTGRLVPVYPQTYGVSSKWLRVRMWELLEVLQPTSLEEFLPQKILTNFNLPDFYSSIKKVHFPSTLEEAQLARRRLAFDELLTLQLTNVYKRLEWQKNEPAYNIKIDKKILDQFISSLPFTLTSAQIKAIDEIREDLVKPVPMNRLLEGDVGSGKTVVAAAACFAAFKSGYKSAIMAPTQILAQQHYHSLKNIMSIFGIGVKLVTSDGVVNSSVREDITIGTHALIHKKAHLEECALVVIDEQHRFGVEQRAHLISKTKKGSVAPHVLTMTATPIPRTVALTLYGELELSILDELPKGRIPIITWIVPPDKRPGAYDWIKHKVSSEKIQVFVICPLIEESDSETLKQVKGATKEYETLKKVFPEFRIGLLHGRMKLEEKNKILDKFRAGEMEILVTTPVVEVGVDIPNANIMIIEAAERFGLAQLHQLRGRIGRGDKKSYCMLFSENRNKKVDQRLAAMKKYTSGFELAEIDLTLRGPGEVMGIKQHGGTELKIASWQDIDLIKDTKKLATEITNNQEEYKDLLTWFKKKQIVGN